MSSSRGPYDPMRSVYGMWNGSLIRIANLFKDPAQYKDGTPAVLTETAKRYQDALDDCEIQILEAKWYLEHQLALNKARREQQASESLTAPNKRKLEELRKDINGHNESPEENPAKRVKVSDEESGEARATVNGTENAPEPTSVTESAADPKNKAKEANPDDDKSTIVPHDPKPKAILDQPKPPDPKPEPLQIATTTDPTNPFDTTTTADAQKPSVQNSAASNDQAYNFDSMFDDPVDNADTAGDDNMDFGMDLDTFGDGIAGEDNNTALDGLLGGIESYANQSGDEFLNFPLADGGGVGGAEAGVGQAGNMFDLPALGDTTFDDFLNDDTLTGGGLGGDGGGADLLNGDDLMNLGELDDCFFNN